MAKGALRTLGVGMVGFGMALALREAKTPGSAVETLDTSLNVAVPLVQSAGVLGGETLSATEPVAQGARNAMSGFGQAVAPDTATDDTLPTTPLEGN